MITQAIVLSAGTGTRLRPLTDNIPKVMVPIAGRPLLEHHVLRLREAGVKEIFINLHYLPDVIRNHFGYGSRFGVSVKYSYEPEPLGTAGGIKHFEKEVSDACFVVYGDVYNELDYREFGDELCRHADAIAVSVVGDTDHPYDSDLAEVDNDLRFLKVHKKPHEKLPARYKAIRGIYAFRSGVFHHIPYRVYCEIDHQLVPGLIARGLAVYGFESKHFIKDIGTPERYQSVTDYLAMKTPRP